MAKIYSYLDAYGNLLEVEEVMIPGVGLGVIVHTTHRGPCLPLEEVPRFTNALIAGLNLSPTKERQPNGDHDSAAGTQGVVSC